MYFEFERTIRERIDTASKRHPLLQGNSDYLKRVKKLEKLPVKRNAFTLISKLHKLKEYKPVNYIKKIAVISVPIKIYVIITV